MEIGIEQDPTENDGENEDVENFVGVVIDPAVEARLAGNPDGVLIGLERLFDRAVNLVENALIVEPALDEVGLDEQRLPIERHQLAVDLFGVVANLLDLLDLFVGFGRPAHHRWSGDGPAQHGEVASGAVPNRGDLVMVDAIDPVHRLGHIVDLPEYLFGEDVAFIDPQHDVDVVRPAELAGKAEMDLHERMPVGEQVVKGGAHLDLKGLVGHKGGEEASDERHRQTILNEAGP